MKTEEALRHLNVHGNDVPDDVQGVIFLRDHSKLREWAAKNAFSILFLVFMFFITWVLLLITNW